MLSNTITNPASFRFYRWQQDNMLSDKQAAVLYGVSVTRWRQWVRNEPPVDASERFEAVEAEQRRSICRTPLDRSLSLLSLKPRPGRKSVLEAPNNINFR